MTRKQYYRRMEYIKGYRRGYQWRGLPTKELQSKNDDFKRGYREGRQDYKANETALY